MRHFRETSEANCPLLKPVRRLKAVFKNPEKNAINCALIIKEEINKI